MSSRYTFTYEVGGKCECYAESTTEEESLDLVTVEDSYGRDVGVAYMVGFTGNGYLSFWSRCKQMVSDWHKENPTSTNQGTLHFYDNWYEEELTK